MLKQILYKLFGIEKEVCYNCEFLKTILEQERAEKSQIIKLLIAKDKEPERAPIIPQELKPVSWGKIPWAVMKQQLERADRLQAQNDRENKIADLEKELQVNE